MAMGTDQLKELKRLQKENERLRKAVSDLTLDKLILTQAAKGIPLTGRLCEAMPRGFQALLVAVPASIMCASR